MRKTRRLRRHLLPVSLGIALAAAVAACSSGSGGSSAASGGSSSSGSAVVTQAQTMVNAHTAVPTVIGPTQAVGKPIPTGKHIVLIYPGQSAVGGQIVFTGFKQAAQKLGWSVTSLYPAVPTPQDLQQAMNQAIQLHPDAVIINSVDDVEFQKQVATLQSMHIPVIADFSPDSTGGPITLSLMGAQGQGALASVIGAKAVADLGGSGELGVIGLQGYTIVQDYTAYFKTEVKKLCPSCSIVENDLPLTSLGTSDGSDIVNFLRANPKIKGLLIGYDGLGSDLFSAAKQAGITLPKIYSVSTVPTGIQAVSSGELSATAPVDYPELGWRDADALARIFTGQAASAQSQDVVYERPVIWSDQYHNVPDLGAGSSFPAIVTTYEAQYEKLWGK